MDIFKEYAKLVGEDKVSELRAQGHVIGQIKKARHAKRMSQQKLADAIQMSKSTIARIESGVAVPNLRTLQLIADALDTPLTIQPDRRELETIR
jgi:transcriptional regulator with XRE-family HTH domain